MCGLSMKEVLALIFSCGKMGRLPIKQPQYSPDNGEVPGHYIHTLPVLHPRLLVSPKKELVHTSDTPAFVAATQMTHP